MADRFPLVVDSSNQNIKELPDGDSLLLGDSEKLRFGDGQDLDIYHDGSHSYVQDTGTGHLRLSGNNVQLVNTAVDSNYIICANGGAVDIYHAGNKKLETTATGVNITGVATASTSANITEVALTNASSIVWDAAAKANATLALNADSYAGNVTFAAPGNPVAGAIISVEIAQDGTPRTVAWNTIFEFAASTAPVVTATANKTDIFAFRYNGSVWQEIGRVQNMAQT